MKTFLVCTLLFLLLCIPGCHFLQIGGYGAAGGGDGTAGQFSAGSGGADASTSGSGGSCAGGSCSACGK